MVLRDGELIIGDTIIKGNGYCIDSVECVNINVLIRKKHIIKLN